MNKILLNLLVVGASLACIQGASGMDVESDSQSYYKKMLTSSAWNKENINNFNIDDNNEVHSKKSKNKQIEATQVKHNTYLALFSEFDSVIESPYTPYTPYTPYSPCHDLYDSQEPEIQGLNINQGITIDSEELDYLFTNQSHTGA